MVSLSLILEDGIIRYGGRLSLNELWTEISILSVSMALARTIHSNAHRHINGISTCTDMYAQ